MQLGALAVWSCNVVASYPCCPCWLFSRVMTMATTTTTQQPFMLHARAPLLLPQRLVCVSMASALFRRLTCYSARQCAMTSVRRLLPFARSDPFPVCLRFSTTHGDFFCVFLLCFWLCVSHSGGAPVPRTGDLLTSRAAEGPRGEQRSRSRPSFRRRS